MSAADEITAIAGRLTEIAASLRAEDSGGEGADELAREAADLVTRAGNQLERAVADAESSEAG